MRDRTLWFAIFGGPIAWSVDVLAAIAIENDYCAHGPRNALGSGVAVALSAIAISAAAVTVFAAMAGWRHLQNAGADTGFGNADEDRRRFMARFAVGLSVLCLFGIVLRLITVVFISAAAC